MTKFLIMICLLFFPAIGHAEDIYCGEFNGKPAYVDIDSIEKQSLKTGAWITTDGVAYPEQSHSYVANIYADGLWYKVYFSIKNQSSYLAWILDKNRKRTHESITTIHFDFAFQTVQEYYSEANQRSEATARTRRNAP